MAVGEKTVKIRFTGDVKGLDKASKDAEKSIRSFGTKVSDGIKNMTSKLPDMLSGVIGSLPPQGQAIALAMTAGLAVALAGAIGAALSTAVLMVAGGGILALGIKSAIDSPKVTKAFDGLKKKAAKVFEDFGRPFEEPLVRAAKTFEGVLADLEPHIKELGKLVAPIIDKLAPALGEFLKAVMPGIKNAVKASMPLFETLAKHLPLIGEAIGKFFSQISENGDDANQFLDDFLYGIEGLIIAVGWVISKLTALYGNIRTGLTNSKTLFLTFASVLLAQFQKILDGAVLAFGWMPGIGPKLKEAQKKFADFRADVNAELAKIKDRQVKINVWSNVGAVAGRVADILAGLKGANIGKRAMGGPVSAGRTYLVGERGPELLTMSGNGYVTPNHKLNENSGGNVYEIVLDIGEGITQRFRIHDRDLKRKVQAA